MKPAQWRALERLAQRRIAPERIIDRDSARALAAISGELNRQVGLLIHRSGRIEAVVVGDSMYVLGGGQYSPEEGPMDIHRLDLEHMIWFQHDLGCMAPQARIAHT